MAVVEEAGRTPRPEADDTGSAARGPDARHVEGADEDVVRRLRSVEGHIRGVERMVREGAYCIDVVNQILAIQRALKKVSSRVLDGHLHSCVTGAMRGTDESARERVLTELIDVFEASGKA